MMPPELSALAEKKVWLRSVPVERVKLSVVITPVFKKSRLGS